MKKGLIVVIAIVAVIIVGVIAYVGIYNGLVSEKEKLDSSLSTIDVQLKRRTDLIPNLVNTVKGFAAHEKEAIDSVTNARAKMAGAGTVADKANADGELTGALSRLMLVVENYPQLKADANFRQLSDELAGTENRIAVAREDYNSAAKSYNVKIKSFPANLVSGMMGYEKADYFELLEVEKENPKVEF